MKRELIFILLVTLISCNSSKRIKTTTYWVNSNKTECMGGAPLKCMQVQKGDKLHEDAWEYFYSSIEGFDFEPGYIYKLSVKEQQLPLEQVPADASSIKYSLVNVLEKRVDNRSLINGKWLLARINGTSVNRLVALPILEISFGEMAVSGTSGCNAYWVVIQKLTSMSIQISNIINTQKACLKRNIEEGYLKAPVRTVTYRIEGDKLVFYGKQGNELLAFLKWGDTTASEAKE